MQEIQHIIKTKLVGALPSVTEPNTQYMVENGGKFDMFLTDEDNIIRQLEIETNRNLLKKSPIMMLLNQVSNTGRTNAFVTSRLWDDPVIYGMWQDRENQANSEWGIHSIGPELNFHLFEEDLRNKEITVSVDVKAEHYETIIGLNPLGRADMPFTIQPNKWYRIYTTATTTHLPGIVAKLKNNADPKRNHTALINSIAYKNWKVEYGKVMTAYNQAMFDLGSNEVCYVKTHKLPNPASFRTDEPIETRYQDGIQVGLTARNTSIRVYLNKYTFRCRYIFLQDNASVTFTGVNIIKTNAPDGGATLTGNRGDWVEFSYFQDEYNRMMAVAKVVKNEQIDVGNFIQKRNETNLVLANGNTLSRDAYHWITPGNKHFLQSDGTKVNPNTLYKSQETEELQNNQIYSTNKLDIDSGTYKVNHGVSFSEILVNFNMRKGSASALQFKKSYQDGSRLSIRNYIDNNTPTSWRELAYASELVAYGETKSGANVVIHNWETKNTFFLTGSGNMSVDVSSLQDGRIVAFKKCYNGGVITFVCRNKQIILKGATSFNGAEGSNAVVSIVGGKCYIDLNNY